MDTPNKYSSHESQLIHEGWITLEKYLHLDLGLADKPYRMKAYKKKYYKKFNTSNITDWATKPVQQIKIALDNDLIK